VTRAARRVGFRSARELGWLGYNVRHVIPRDLHAVDAMLALVRAEGVEPIRDMRLYVADADRAWWSRRRDALGAEGPYAVLAPTARWTSKRWPVERWRSAIDGLAARGFERILLVGAPDERSQVRGLVAGARSAGSCVIDLVGETSIGQMMAVIAGAGIVLANDSAPLHMAVGLDRPCVGLFGPTDPDRVGPYRRPEAVVRADGQDSTTSVRYRQRGLDDGIMRRISVSAVLERVDAVLAAGAMRCEEAAR
jgi:ADP-heptose:LPS heptosyltransferase